ncbi:hypothetical protein ACFOLF_34435 [Paenibacillus sepulcri]|uniref:DUF4871 domain-containing protein n=1 Tax=Paenibacillus sepulcri TaxID=359917 RepID=A0ABS7CC18_9BACL|nr:hypothetical protein [Paenibacillus sepulcri]
MFIRMTILVGLMILITACSASNYDREWEPSGTFEAGGLTMYGKENRLGFVPRGNSVISKGGHFTIYFWGKPEEIADTFKLMGVHQKTGAIETLYSDWEVTRTENKVGADAQGGVKFNLDQDGTKKGKWRLEVYMGDTYFDSIVVEAA